MEVILESVRILCDGSQLGICIACCGVSGGLPLTASCLSPRGPALMAVLRRCH